MKNKYRIWIALSLLVVFGLGAAAGVFGERYLTHKKFRRPPEPRPHFPTLETMAQELELTTGQQEQIREIFKRSEERLKEFRSDTNARLWELRRTLKVEVDAVLTPEQVQKMEDLIRRYSEMRKRAPTGKEQNGRRDREREAPAGDKGVER
jgi:Spy/CpxP family protein refolding chaperone